MTQSYPLGYPENKQSGLPELSLNQPSLTVTTQAKAKNNPKIYWLLGGFTALVFLIGGFLVLGVLGLYFYTQRTNTVYAEKYPKPVVKPTMPAPQPETKPGITNQDLKNLYQEKKKVGKFELVEMFDDKKSAYFLGTEAEVSAVYKNFGKNQTVIIALATFLSKEKARNEFMAMIKAEKKAGVKMFSDLAENEKSIAASFQDGKFYVLMFCRFRDDSSTPCYRIVSTQRGAVVDFYDGFFAK